jgi:hypothetical protein
VGDTTRPVWLAATESFSKKMNRIAKECELSPYEARRIGLDALPQGKVRRKALSEEAAASSLAHNLSMV